MILGLSLIAFAELFFHVVAVAFLFTFLLRSHAPQLRFRAAFNRPESEDQALRRFIVTVEPKDDNITIFEEGNPAAGTVQPTGGIRRTYLLLPMRSFRRSAAIYTHSSMLHLSVTSARYCR